MGSFAAWSRARVKDTFTGHRRDEFRGKLCRLVLDRGMALGEKWKRCDCRGCLECLGLGSELSRQVHRRVEAGRRSQ